MIREATADDVEAVRGILLEAAAWLRESGNELWRENELRPELVAGDIEARTVFLAENAGEAGGTLRFQLRDDLFWPDVDPKDSAFVHRLAVRRQHAGSDLSTAMLEWAVARAAALGKRYLRLDCDRPRTKLRAVYERFGFRWHSDRRVGRFCVARYEYRIPISDAS